MNRAIRFVRSGLIYLVAWNVGIMIVASLFQTISAELHKPPSYGNDQVRVITTAT